MKTTSHMSIGKTGIVPWRGSGFLLQTLKKEYEVFFQPCF